jgi:phage baseplate assembly protein gpV
MSQELDILGLLEGRVSTFEGEIEDAEQRVHGVTLAEVSDLDDPQGLGRVKLKFPWLSSQTDSAWARIATAWAGENRGSYLLPEIGDEALVAFRHGSLQHPYVVGFLWSETARPPERTPRADKRELRSRSGHKITFDDRPGKQSLTIESQGGHTIVLDDSDAQPRISITDSGGLLEIVFDVRRGKVTVSNSVGPVDVSAPSGVVTVYGANVAVHAKGTLELKGQSVVIEGKTVSIN